MHLLANIAAFAPPRYHTLLFESFTALLHLLATVISTLPAGALERKLPISVGKQVADSESDSDLEDSTNPTFVSRTPLPRLDDRTVKRLQTLPSTAHISSLLRITKNQTAARIALCDFLLALCTAWPDRIDSILSTVVVSTGGGLVRELYRNYVRSSPLGKEVSLSMLLGMSSPFCLIRHLPTPFRYCKCRSLVPTALPDRFVHALASHHGRRRVFFRTGRTHSP
jgi:ubiquitin-protein ligase E3 C